MKFAALALSALLLSVAHAQGQAPPPAAAVEVIFSNVKPFSIDASEVTIDHSYEPGTYIKVSGHWYKFKTSADREVIRAWLAERTVSRPAPPFYSYSDSRIVEGERSLPVGQIPSLKFLDDLERYMPAVRTQFSQRRVVGNLGSVPRSRLELKWNHPGGTAHLQVDGITSALYRSRNTRAVVFLKRQNPQDRASVVTWDRTYKDGQVFADVLRYRGRIFEARAAVKRSGEWDRFVAYFDIEARPPGYQRLTSSQCAECHSQAGLAEYQGAAIPGGDGILSDPIPQVESGEVVQGGNGTRL